MRVLIIGAGLGGLTLRHGLRGAGVDAQVFERSTDQGAQPASYGAPTMSPTAARRATPR